MVHGTEGTVQGQDVEHENLCLGPGSNAS